jgi:chemotaxis protein MotB
MSAKSNAPIIIKRKKLIAAGHHGGAWKVAYADFVTAMMAFFMMMWLLNATTEKQRKGLADYFSPTIPLSRVSGGGEGSFGGDSVFTEETLAQNGTGASQNKPTSSVAAKGDSGVDPADDSSGQDQKSFAQIEDALSAMSGESMTANDMLRHIVTRVTDEGLIVELFDLPGEVLFQPRTDTPTPVMVELAEMISGIFALVGNQVAVNGFVRSEPIVLTRNPVWDLSSSRANRVRLLLQNTGFPSQRVQRVTGFADRVPAARNLMAARNNRIELILLRRPPGRNR